MSLTVTDRGANSTNTGAQQTLAVSPASDLAVGSLAVLCVAYDNAGTNGADPYSSISDNAGNTWVSQQAALNDPGAANAGMTLRIFTSVLTAALPTSKVVTVSFGVTTVVARAWALFEVVPGTGNQVTYQTGNVGTASTASPTITTASINSGEAVVAAVGAQSGTTQTFTGDADTTNGNWSTQQTSKVGATTAGAGISAQSKVVNADGAQTYNPTLGISSDLCLAWVSAKEIPGGVKSLSSPLLCGRSMSSTLLGG